MSWSAFLYKIMGSTRLMRIIVRIHGANESVVAMGQK